MVISLNNKQEYGAAASLLKKTAEENRPWWFTFSHSRTAIAMNASEGDVMQPVEAGTRLVARWVQEPLRAVKYAVQDGVAIITLSR